MLFWFFNGLKHYIIFMCAILYFNSYIHYGMLTTKSLVSIPHHRVASLYPFHPPSTPSPSGNHYSVLFIYVFGLVCSLILLCFIFSTYEWNHAISVFLWVISLSIIPSRSIHIWQIARLARFHPFLWLSSIPLCI